MLRNFLHTFFMNPKCYFNIPFESLGRTNGLQNTDLFAEIRKQQEFIHEI